MNDVPDIEALVDMLERAGVEHVVEPANTYDIEANRGAHRCVQINALAHSETNPGYSGFFTRWMFDADGHLVAVGTWE